MTTDGTEQLIAKIVELATNGVHRVAGNAQLFEGLVAVKPLNQIALGAKLVADKAVLMVRQFEAKTENLTGKKTNPAKRMKAVAKAAVKPEAKASASAAAAESMTVAKKAVRKSSRSAKVAVASAETASA